MDSSVFKVGKVHYFQKEILSFNSSPHFGKVSNPREASFGLQNGTRHFLQIVSLGVQYLKDNSHERSNPVSRKNMENIRKCHLLII